MTWNQLKEEAKKMGYHYHDVVYLNGEQFSWIENYGYLFTCDGKVAYDDVAFAFSRTPDQMLAIMKALQ